ncbi:MAG: hypothetical protein R3292_00345 [Alcanivorax sp.]|nr:hypothetical protein [Alcanivorax sp.]
MKKVILAGLTAAVMSSTAMASDVTGYTAPVSGQAATAAGVDGNFQALISAINDNNARIAALEAQVAASQSKDVTGKTYLYRDLGLIFAAHRYGTNTAFDATEPDAVPDGYARAGYYMGAYTVTFNADHTLTMTGQDTDVEMAVNASSDISQQKAPASGSGTWTQSGNTLTIDLGDGPVNFEVTPGAQMIAGYTNSDPTVTFDYNDGTNGGSGGTGDRYTHEYEVNMGYGILQQ